MYARDALVAAPAVSQLPASAGAVSPMIPARAVRRRNCRRGMRMAFFGSSIILVSLVRLRCLVHGEVVFQVLVAHGRVLAALGQRAYLLDHVRLQLAHG